MSSTQTKKFDPATVRADFPILNQTIHKNRQLIYFDNGASTQRPQSVIEAMNDCYLRTYANVHRGIHYLSERSSEQYENARIAVQQLIGAEHSNEIIFTSGTTAAINIVARSLFEDGRVLEPDDEILLTIMEHHSNIVPWQQLAERTGAVVKFVGLTKDGQLDMDDFKDQLNKRTRMVAVTAVSNVLGVHNPITEIVDLAKSVGAYVLVDAAQHVPHERLSVNNWGADFVVFSGHKMLGPSGIGILYGRQALLEEMPPFLGGGSMISTVTTDGYTSGELPAKFEAGTPPIVEAIGLHAAIDYLNEIGLDRIQAHENELVILVHQLLAEINGLHVLGPGPKHKAGIVSFVVEGLSTQDISIFLDRQGVAIRAGHHCAMPLHDYLGIKNSCRASFYLYSTREEVERFAKVLTGVVEKLR